MIATTPEQLMGEYALRTNTHQFSAVAELIAEDAVYWFNDGSFVGLDAIRKAFESTWAYIRDESYSVEDVQWLGVDESVAACTYAFRWQGLVDGKMVRGSGRGTNVLQKRDGRWLVVHEHLSPHPKP